MQSLAIYGPNLPDQSKGQFHVHDVNCADRVKLDRDPRVEQPWIIQAATRKAVVLDVYPPGEFNYDADAEWGAFDDLWFAPCVKLPAQ